MANAAFLGVDIGSVSVSTALVDHDGGVISAERILHGGKVRETLRGQLAMFGSVPIAAIGCTPGAASVLREARLVDSQVALIAAIRRLFPGARSILHVGGEKFALIRLGEHGQYLGARSNSSCAAGTGSFLDQQARRLGFAGVQELDRTARENTSAPPRISTRCAVFARTDLVHAQQAGYTLAEICDGLCQGVALTIADTLAHGEPLEAPAVFTGGVSLNCAVRRHLEEIFGIPLEVSPYGTMAGAIGAAFCAGEHASQSHSAPLDPEKVLAPVQETREYSYAPLPLDDADPSRHGEVWVYEAGTHSRAHSVEVEEYASTRSAGTPYESTRSTSTSYASTRPVGAPAPGGPAGDLPVHLGIDVGSTSTKAILIGETGEPVAGFYTRTLGSPLTAVQALCEAIQDFSQRCGANIRIKGAATTGAGRKFIGSIIHADLVIDEITAHARAAYSLDPSIDTIIEIGGQDAKFTTMRDGMVTFSHMNTVCAAGTGSFLEEQAARLGCALSDYSERVRGAPAPLSSDRCAVFMERDINNFLSQGFSTEEILAAALYSVRENYLQKVARGAAIGKKVAFQGATARNKALAAAFR